MSERFFTRNEQSLKTEAQKAFDFSKFAKMPEVRQQPQQPDQSNNNK